MKTSILGLGAAALALGGVAVFAGNALAYLGDPGVRGPLYSTERHDAMEQAFEHKDYGAWTKLMEDRGQARVTQVVNENNFSKFAEAHELAEQGKMVEAKQIRQELGLGLRNGSGQGMGRGANR